MSQNPFDALGGGLDMNALLQQAQQMQQQLVAAQEELARAEVTGTAGGGLVTATMTGTGELIALTIDPSVAVRARRAVERMVNLQS